jgi:predicted transcriptional regulator
MRRQFVLDKQSDALLERLAAARAGNRSYVIREAISLYASLEDRLEKIEATPAFQKQMQRTAEDIAAGRTLTHSQVKSQIRKVARSKR